MRCYEDVLAERMRALIRKTMDDKDTLGGVVGSRRWACPRAWAAHRAGWPHSTRLMAAVGSIHAVKGVEIGDGSAESLHPGTRSQDELTVVDGNLTLGSDHAGGLERVPKWHAHRGSSGLQTNRHHPEPVEVGQYRDGRSSNDQVQSAATAARCHGRCLSSRPWFASAGGCADRKLGGDSIGEMMPRFDALRRMRLSDLPMDNTPWRFNYE